MEGPCIHDKELAGVIPRTVREIFFLVAEAPDSLEFVIKARRLLSRRGGEALFRRGEEEDAFIRGGRDALFRRREEALFRCFGGGGRGEVLMIVHAIVIGVRDH